MTFVKPGFTFDKENNRLGRGGGYYNKFFKKTGGKKVAICYREQHCEEVPVEEHDIKMDKIISD